MQTSLVTKIGGLEWADSSKGLVAQCKEPEKLKTVIAEGLFDAINLYSDVPEKSVSLMVNSFWEEYQYDNIDVFIEVIENIAKGKRKIFGRVTPNDLREMITEVLEKRSIAREAKHEAQKIKAYIPRGKQTSLRDWIKGQKRK